MSLLLLFRGGAAVQPPVEPPASTAAGHGTRGIAIEAHGRILTFETEKEASEWIAAQAPKQAKVIRKLARKVVQDGGENLLLAPLAVEDAYDPPQLLTGSPQLRALVEMHAAVLKAKFSNETARLAKERAQQDEEDEMTAAFMMMFA